MSEKLVVITSPAKHVKSRASQAALNLACHDDRPPSFQLIRLMQRIDAGEITTDQAVQLVIHRYAKPSPKGEGG